MQARDSLKSAEESMDIGGNASVAGFPGRGFRPKSCLTLLREQGKRNETCPCVGHIAGHDTHSMRISFKRFNIPNPTIKERL